MFFKFDLYGNDIHLYMDIDMNIKQYIYIQLIIIIINKIYVLILIVSSLKNNRYISTNINFKQILLIKKIINNKISILILKIKYK